ncbi:MAG: polysaccharide biosynthesis/export family protein [Thermodesulfobacteriota bacterium]|nr:polysaccharide biosynthesis/export family protein [Thermodesulfobacteriota bacterium]
MMILDAGRVNRLNRTGGCQTSTALAIGLIIMMFHVLGGSFFSASTVFAQEKPPVTKTNVYEIAAGDVLNVFVYEEPEITQNVVVRNDGRISMPLIGDVMAAGTTPELLSEIITLKLSKYIEAVEVSVILVEGNGQVYYVLGQISAPGQYRITRPVTVLQAIARAGGFLEWAKKSRIMVVGESNPKAKITYFNYDDFLEGKDVGKNVVLKPGDTIVVP